LLGETLNVIPKGFIRLLFAASKIPRVAKAHVGSLEVPLEHSHEVVLVVDLSRWEVLEPGSSGIRQEQGELSNDNPVVGGPTQLTGQAEVSELKFGFGLVVILGKSHGGRNRAGSIVLRMALLKTRGPGGLGEGLRSSELS
jgi:hypothetical protein